jgi:DNA-binding response OmpR family regulator
MDFPDGRTLARQMRASGSNRGTPIVMISDDQRPGAVSEGFEAGASFFLYKPVDKERLQKLVRATQATIESGMRRTRRVELKSKVNIRFRGQEIEGETINVSLEGMLIRAPKMVPIGSSVEVCLQMSRTEKPIAGGVPWCACTDGKKWGFIWGG